MLPWGLGAIDTAVIKKYFDKVKDTYARLLSSEKSRPLLLIIIFVIVLVLIILPLITLILTPAQHALPANPVTASTTKKKKEKKSKASTDHKNTHPEKSGDSYTAKMKNIYRKIQLSEIEEEFLKRKVSVEKMRKELGIKGQSIFDDESKSSEFSRKKVDSSQNPTKKTYKPGEARDYEIVLIFVDKDRQETIATITDGETTTDVQAGDILPDRTKVIAISPEAVIFEHQNKLSKKEVH